MKGKLITFEGIDGCGKSTQASLLYKKLISFGIPCSLLREPGGTEIGENIRSILLDSKNHNMSSFTELFLYLAARSQIVQSVILPELNNGHSVIMDRFIDSTVAYQGFARGLGFEITTSLNKIATYGLMPDVTFLIDCDPSIAYKRLGPKHDRLESEGISFMKKVREGFLLAASENKNRFFTYDGSNDVESIHNSIFEKINSLNLFSFCK